MSSTLTVPRQAVPTVERLHTLWGALVDPWGVRTSRFRFLLLDAERRPLARLVDIEVGVPDAEWLAIVISIISDMVAEFASGGSVAVMLQRPGPASIGREDRAWLQMLADAGDPEVFCWPTALCAGESVRMVTRQRPPRRTSGADSE